MNPAGIKDPSNHSSFQHLSDWLLVTCEFADPAFQRGSDSSLKILDSDRLGHPAVVVADGVRPPGLA